MDIPTGRQLYMKEYNKRYRESKKAELFIKSKEYRERNKETIRERRRLKHILNREQENARNKRYYETHKEERSEYSKEKYREDKEPYRQRMKKYRETHKEELREKKKIYRENNRGQINARKAKRSAAKIQATPPWLSKDQLIDIEWIYHCAVWITEETGIPHEVDHIVPLQGEGVRGLHVPWNLQILTAKENASKCNRY